MQPALKEIKKELGHLSQAQLSDISLRLAKYKKDNKELLVYLLYHADDPLSYADEIKASLADDFANLPSGYYYSTKTLRKILRTLSRHAKYTASKQAELELLVWFCKNFLEHADLRTSHKPLQGLFNRQAEKILKIIPKLHEDLQFDYQQEINEIIAVAKSKLRGFNVLQ